MADCSANMQSRLKAAEERNGQLEERIRQLEAENRQLLRAMTENSKEGQKEAETEEAGKKQAELAKDGEEKLLLLLEARIAELEEEAKRKDAELARVHKSPGSILGEGRIKWRMDLDAVGEETIFSPSTDIGGVPFRIGCKATVSEYGKEEELSFYVACNDAGSEKTFFAKADIELKHRSALTCRQEFTPLGPRSRDFSSAARRYLHNYIVDGHYMEIEAKIKLVCFYKNGFADFSSPDPLLTDVTLLVEGKEFNVNRIFLAHYSGYFKILFLKENGKKTVELSDVGAVDFEKLLRIIYPGKGVKVDSENVNDLVRLAAFFDVPCVRALCSDYLMRGFCCVDYDHKLELAGEFHLPELRNWAVNELLRLKRLPKYLTPSVFNRFSNDVKECILRRSQGLPNLPCAKKARFDFHYADPLLSDVILLVGETELHANKAVLTLLSGYFKGIFITDKDMERVQLPEEVDAKQFEHFLHLCYPPAVNTEVTEENVDSLLRLADFFDVPSARWEVIDQLIADRGGRLPLGVKFRLSEVYGLPELQEGLFSHFDPNKSNKEIVHSKGFEELSIALQLDILKKVAEGRYLFEI